MLSNREAERKNGFFRQFSSSTEISDTLIDLGSPQYFFAGLNEKYLYLANASAKAMLVQVDKNDLSYQFKYVTDAKNTGIKWENSTCRIAGDQFYIIVGNQRQVISGKIEDSLRPAHFTIYPEGFYNMLPLSDSTIITNYFDTIWQQRSIARYSSTKRMDRSKIPFLQKQLDGRFCTDGQLIVDEKSLVVVYLYFYRNQFVVSDTSLLVKYGANTIDTNTVIKIKLGYKKKGKIITFATVPPLVNKRGCIDNNRLYVISNLRADNERLEDFNANAVVDVYDLSKGEYLNSFYLPNKDNKGPQDIRVSGDTVYTIHDRYLRSFAIF